MLNPLVSIIIPFKNTENYLIECLESIRSQTYSNFEVIAIDDGSTDSSRDLLDIYTTKDNRIKVFKNSGSGIIDALQLAYTKTSGDFISRMDSDDIMTPNRIKIMVNSLLQHGKKHIAIGQVKYFSKNGVNDGYLRYEKWLNSLTATGLNYSEIYKECVIPSPCWMAYKSDFDACGGFRPNTYPEDYDLAFRFYEHNYICIPCDIVLHHWRDYSVRASRTSEHYAENSFLDLKINYFTKLDFKPSDKLVVWGAGKKGKSVATKLIDKEIDFIWVCDNEKKIGKHIYDVKMQSYTIIKNLDNLKVIITVANDDDQKAITSYLEKQNLQASKDYYFFC
ncbi:glycosyltransferase [Cellulophaga baltica]|uniref:glycosyltransferase family 2 protein n=1 Tax=Cellulophaga TaxID=104264 RepID=UPI001C07EE07|nr:MULTISPECIES: glycosyltransferase family 2 protein [Cellulophaga]MBU2996154.1 glycosyltransferase [Cellulophaga baltica]MDO6767549.1 glycosyltransferase family 2 protein [Cellulophaga sp. 1_MG-2023]